MLRFITIWSCTFYSTPTLICASNSDQAWKNVQILFCCSDTGWVFWRYSAISAVSCSAAKPPPLPSQFTIPNPHVQTLWKRETLPAACSLKWPEPLLHISLTWISSFWLVDVSIWTNEMHVIWVRPMVDVGAVSVSGTAKSGLIRELQVSHKSHPGIHGKTARLWRLFLRWGRFAKRWSMVDTILAEVNNKEHPHNPVDKTALRKYTVKTNWQYDNIRIINYVRKSEAIRHT